MNNNNNNNNIYYMYYIIYNILATKANELSEMGYLAFAFQRLPRKSTYRQPDRGAKENCMGYLCDTYCNSKANPWQSVWATVNRRGHT